MRLGRLVVALTFACSGAGAARADWKYTSWGMTPEQVIRASDHRATAGTDLLPDSDGNISKLVAPYQEDSETFEAQFGFDAADKLASVTLVLKDKLASMETDMLSNMAADMAPDKSMARRSCADLQAKVIADYGPPQGGGIADMLYSIETWQDQNYKNNVNYTVLYGTGCFVQYSVIKPAGAH